MMYRKPYLDEVVRLQRGERKTEREVGAPDSVEKQLEGSAQPAPDDLAWEEGLQEAVQGVTDSEVA
jgi:hypothetical protein